MKRVNDVLDAIRERSKSTEFLPTGFAGLDGFLHGGFLRQELEVIGGFTGVGKSYVSGQIFLNLALQGFKCAYFSLEISNEMLVSRLVGGMSGIHPMDLISGSVRFELIDDRAKAEAELALNSDFLSFYDDVYELEQIKKEVKENEYDFIVVDFIQNVVVQGNNDEYTRLTMIARDLQLLAKEANCCILVLSQLSNKVAQGGGATVEYKGSGAIAHVCDLGFVIERTGDFTDNELTMTLKKNRRGASMKQTFLQYSLPGGRIHEKKETSVISGVSRYGTSTGRR